MSLAKQLATSPAVRVWALFEEICHCPRPSGMEEAIRRYLIHFAHTHNWNARTDSAGNLVLTVPPLIPTAVPPLILQGHMDMVTEKNQGSTHDFLHAPIEPQVDHGWIKAKGTTLGADNGIGIALALALAEDETLPRPPLELLFTVEEETGLCGALALDSKWLTGRRLLNLDSERDTNFIIGCAGGQDLEICFPGKNVTVQPADVQTRLTLTGFQGGHSGVDIHKNRKNAILALTTLVRKLQQIQPDFVLLNCTGGSRNNAIPRECRVLLAGRPGKQAENLIEKTLADWQKIEPAAELQIETRPAATINWQPNTALLTFLARLPNGVLDMNPDFPEQVCLSSSLGVAEEKNGKTCLHLLLRSSADADRDELATQIMGLAETCGAVCRLSGRYPGWSPKPDNPLLHQARQAFLQVFQREPCIETIHAGLEAGIIGAALNTDDLLAFGPTIENAHSPDERLQIESVEKSLRFLRSFLSALANSDHPDTRILESQ